MLLITVIIIVRNIESNMTFLKCWVELLPETFYAMMFCTSISCCGFIHFPFNWASSGLLSGWVKAHKESYRSNKALNKSSSITEILYGSHLIFKTLNVKEQARTGILLTTTINQAQGKKKKITNFNCGSVWEFLESFNLLCSDNS